MLISIIRTPINLTAAQSITLVIFPLICNVCVPGERSGGVVPAVLYPGGWVNVWRGAGGANWRCCSGGVVPRWLGKCLEAENFTPIENLKSVLLYLEK